MSAPSTATPINPAPFTVSVCMVTYNHAKFIAQAIESVIAQQTNFEWELVIGEDASTDETQAIIKQYQQQQPGRIRLVTSAENIGAQPNFIRTYGLCQGKYIAMIEGDDYWTSPNKLQKQVDFLDRHPDYVLCFHNVRVQQEGSTAHVLYNQPTQALTTSAVDLALRNYIATVSCMYRRVFVEMPDWFSLASAGDYSLHMLHARYGKIGYLPEVMAVYREHAQSSWQSKSAFFKQTNLFKTLAFLLPEFDGAVQAQLVSSQLTALKSALADDNASAADKSSFLASSASEIQSLLSIVQPQFEEQRIKVKSLEYRIVATFVEPLRNILNR